MVEHFPFLHLVGDVVHHCDEELVGVVLPAGVHLAVHLPKGSEDSLWRKRRGATLVIVVAELDYEGTDIVGTAVVDL